ncbi:hypothetical protein Taro_019000 [Colocasia esculenta]|uniref:Uncharacterized protein n=1 Tax=Colocasia esculenta TaxID=4460 RepID=A0A843USK5_COLES|nr:hypothetical protein [Colocasia esculenta]
MNFKLHLDRKEPPYQNPKQRSRSRLSSCCPASSLCPEQRRTTFQAELKMVSSMKTCKSRKRREEKCYMAHGSSRGSSRSDDSRVSHMSKVSRNSQESGEIPCKTKPKIQVQKNKTSCWNSALSTDE